jgi:hypothetical protein
MERQFVGQGWEHQVYRSKSHPNKVIKVPTPESLRFFKFFRLDPKLVQKEYQEAVSLVADTTIKIPDTRFLYLRDRYYIVQDFIEEDFSLKNARELLKNQGLFELLEKYDRGGSNFISNRGTLYWIDPTVGGSITGFLARRGVLSRRKTRQIKSLIQKLRR